MNPVNPKKVRERLGLNQAGMAHLLGLEGEWGAQTISRWEKNPDSMSGAERFLVEIIDKVSSAREYAIKTKLSKMKEVYRRGRGRPPKSESKRPGDDLSGWHGRSR